MHPAKTQISLGGEYDQSSLCAQWVAKDPVFLHADSEVFAGRTDHFFGFVMRRVIFCLEKDTNNDILWTWSYPAVSEEQRALFTRKSCLSSGGDVFTPFLYSQHNRNWYYIHTCHVQESDNLPKVP